MAGGNVSPRQKMINMMYLVLTALLALNVSAEILKAFHLVEQSLEKSADNIETKNAGTMKAIDKYHTEFPTDSNGNIVWKNAKQARELAKELVEYIEGIKTQVITGAEGRKEDTNGDGNSDDEELTKADDIENHANLMINNKEGEKLRAKINETREKLIALVPKDKQAGIKSDLVTQDYVQEGQSKTWESVMFEHSPAAAVLTLLTKFQGDVKNTEAQVLDILKSSISEADFTFDKLEPKIIPNNGTYITLGSEYSADIFVAASSSKQEASILVNGKTIPVEGGVGKYKVVPTSEGEIKYKGVITAKKPNGMIEEFPFEQSFTALKPMAVISATKMNVVYIGLKNPISVSVPGYSAKEIQVSLSPASAGKLSPDPQTPGGYILEVNRTASNLSIVASVKTKDGKVKQMGEQKYRVKVIPDPVPALGMLEGGKVASAQLKSQNVVRAALKAFAFEGINYIPYEFTFIVTSKRSAPYYGTAQGQSLKPDMIAALSKAQKGDQVIVSSIKVKGPDGVRQLPGGVIIDVQ
ncbi:MAG: gliding motility protein GldM [Bacteroidota bacterium]|jgi:gliding motility-associated protein GldM